MPTMEEFMQRLFPKEEERRRAGQCACCGAPDAADTIRDDLSRMEFQISGLCQTCQDETFGR